MTLIALALAAFLQEPPKPDFAAKLKALEDGYNQELKDYRAAYAAAKTAKDRSTLAEKEPGKEYLPKFRELAKLADGDTAPAALAWMFRLANQLHDGAAAKEAAEALLASHASSPKLAAVASGLQYAHYSGWTWAKDWLRGAIEKGDRDAKAAAMFSLGFQLAGASNATKEDKEEARKLFTSLAKDFADLSPGKRADGQLFELDHLQIGCEAPDFEATDVEGKKFKLSDYRGKVVVVDFWGFW